MKVVELFAGIGGFRLGLEKVDSNYFKTIFANQWEPGKNPQHAAKCYNKNFKDNILMVDDIANIKDKIPNHDLLVGGFPCQDYSVATTKAEGIKGKKGVLWWEILDIVKTKKPKYILLENVDRLIKSPRLQRGRDFGVMLKCLMQENYFIEWRVVDASHYGFPQKRKRVFIFAVKNQKTQILNKAFPTEGINKNRISEINIKNLDLIKLSNNFSFHFWNSGFANKGLIYTEDVLPLKEKPKSLKSILFKGIVNQEDFLTTTQIEKMKYYKSSKKLERKTKNGFKYNYSEGKMNYPDDLKKPGRTLLTSERSLNRSTHIINDLKTNNDRFLLPIEAERMQGFPTDWTKGMPKRMRYFVCGNALVVGLVERIGVEIMKLAKEGEEKNK